MTPPAAPSRRRDSGPRRPRRRTPWRSVLVVLAVLAWLGVAGIGGQAQGRLAQVQQNDAAAFLPESAESTRADALAAQFVAERALPALVVIADAEGGVLDEPQLQAISALVDELPTLSIGNGLNLADATLGEAPAIPAEDGRAVLVPVAIDADQAEARIDGERLSRAVTLTLREELTARAAPVGLVAHVAGPAGITTDLVSAFGGIDGVLLVVALVAVFAILVAVYRSPSLPITVLLTALVALAAAALVIEPLARSEVLTLSGQSQGILSILVVGAATDYSLLLVARYREELTRHEHPYRALAVAWRATLPPILASAITVIAGVLCLTLSDLASNASLGPVAAVGIVAAMAAALTFLPALLVLAGSRSRGIFWPTVPRYAGARAGGGLQEAQHGRGEAGTADDRRQTVTLWQRIADRVSARPRRVWVVTAVALAALAAAAPTFRAGGTDETAIFLGEPDSVRGETLLAEHFAGASAQPVIVITPAEDHERVLDALRAAPGVAAAQVISQGDEASGQPGGQPGTQPDADAGPPVVIDGQVRIDVTTVDASQTQAATATVAQLRELLSESAPESVVGGAAAQRLDTQDAATRDLWVIVPVVLLVITAVLVALLRAVVAPLLLMAANVLSFGAAMGVAALVFNHVLGFPGADATVPLFAFVFLIALGIDYTIFLMTRVREEAHTHGTRPAVWRALATTGGVITSAGIVLAATFAALGVVPLLFLAQIAVIVPVGVLIDTFVVRTLLVPGLVHEVGPRVWWPWARQITADQGS